MSHDAVVTAMRELAREMAVLLPERVAALAAAFERARAAPEDADARQQLRVLAHRMRGTAGSHGFDAISAEAGAIEDELLACTSSLSPARAAALAVRVARLVADAERAAREATR